MKRDKTQQQLKRIKICTPRWFWTKCSECESEYKKEPMFRWRVGVSGPTHHSFTVWNCMKCCPTKVIVIEENERYFGKHNGQALRDAQGSGDSYRDGCWAAKKKGDKHALENEKLAAPPN